MTQLYVTSPKWPDQRAFDSEVKELFGLNAKAKWPAQGMPARSIQGITCWVLPEFPARYVKSWWSNGKDKKVKSSQHRTMAQCPACDRIIPLGRLKQHSKVHT